MNEIIDKWTENNNRAKAYVKSNTTLTESMDIALAIYVLQFYGEDYDPCWDFFSDNPITLPEIEKSIRLIKKWRKLNNYEPIETESIDREQVRDGVFIIKNMTTADKVEYKILGEFIQNNL